MSAGQASAAAVATSEVGGDRFVDLLRHGETLGGARFRGVQDDQLSPAGWAQMRAAVAEGAWERILTSPARRCAAFGEDLAGRLGVPLEVWPEVGERDFGEWEGRSAAEIPIEDLSRFWADPVGYTPPGAEPFAALQARTLVAWRRLRAQDAERLLLITHGGIIRVLLGAVLGMPPSHLLFLEVPHACLSRLRIPAVLGEPSLVAHGRAR
ncbi:histidine phosphatase family protein [Thiococcus pfennigii]|jgi:alpha-ribazole phosphatase|uniref:histidine phosphatase family protein n=1 Tax=Thiococcus pfennigii TaxID=1057 RepID=UPI0019087193|nr:histidine phosphatase family protein [Thiococcus pfennigii]MBK1699687.1 histidine phosphatase family protein [Thiococcus pfennigii]MBK1731536.1 histidine phosphatase family protein [Thiococcus pfennigii]